MTTRLDIVQRALTRIRANPLMSEDGADADAHFRLYTGALHLLLGMSDWSFSVKIRELARDASAPVPASFLYQFALPSDRVAPPMAIYRELADVNAGRPFLDYELIEDRLLTDAEQLFGKYKREPAPYETSLLFRECLVTLTASEYAAFKFEDNELRQALRQEVLGDPRVPGSFGLVHNARTEDARSRPSPVLAIDGGPLIEVRVSGNASRRRLS